MIVPYLAVYSAAPFGLTLESNIGFPFMQAISHALKALGRPDGAIEFFHHDEVEPTISFPSLFAIAQPPGRQPGLQTITDRPIPLPRRYPTLTEATPADRAYAARLIGLSGDDFATLALVEQCLTRSHHDLYRLAQTVQASLPLRRHSEPEIMYKRRLVAAIINAAGIAVL
jgi:hypothetical protein